MQPGYRILVFWNLIHSRNANECEDGNQSRSFQWADNRLGIWGSILSIKQFQANQEGLELENINLKTTYLGQVN